MPFSVGDENINRSGRPKGSFNRSTLVKKHLQDLLGEVLSKELTPETIDATLKKASPSARLRFIEGCLKYMIPAMTMDAELDEIINELQIIKSAKEQENK